MSGPEDADASGSFMRSQHAYLLLAALHHLPDRVSRQGGMRLDRGCALSDRPVGDR